ncbi:MAG: EAL domain-containing protein [Faecalibacterium sp.]
MNSFQKVKPMITSLDPSITPEEEAHRLAIVEYALAQNQVVPYYQGLYNNHTSSIDKYEALMRICGPDGTIYSPGFFMPTAKRNGLYLELNLAMYAQVFHDFSSLDCPFSLNLSPYHLRSESFCDMVFSYLESFHKPSNVVLEILEDECAIDIDVFEPFVEKARGYGAKIAVDDFGAGYSNLLAILKLRPDYLKIDGKIIKDVHTCFENEVIVETVSNMGQKLSIDLVAEFVENADIQKVIEQHGILYSQGYHFSKPAPFSAVCLAEKKI